MSTDDIVFDEVTYREPRRLRRPDRDAARACIACGTPDADDLPIFLDRKPADQIERHALSDTSVELGGILLGYECVDEHDGRPFVWITEALEARHYENTQASFTYTHDSWEEISRERDAKFPDLDIVGWYHTHPDFGIFLSSHDLFIHHHFFAQPLQIAYVVDPIRMTRGFFQWRDGRVTPLDGFTLTAARGERLALARLANDLENLPAATAEAGGGLGLGGLSPRLEAQLIAMLNRPHSTVVAAPMNTAQSAATFGLIGAVLGVLVLAAGLWLSSLARTVEQQAEALGKLEAAVAARSENVQDVRVAAKERALDALLHNVRVGDAQESYVTLYERATSERDRARAELADLTTVNNALKERAQRLEADRATIDRELAAAQARAAKLEEEGKAAQAMLDGLETDLDRQGLIVRPTNAEELAQKYALAWYVAAGALGACVLLGLGLVWAIARSVPPAELADDTDPGDPGSRPSPTPAPHDEGEPPHRIG